ncbi:flagellar motor switch protein FliG [Solirhodobacter olei]|uniref:flagellar motor switch protein FliG n=1 Tax=Solirhodobacter olei TaxID=2493082 RepID=UPI001F4EE195|nr:flagellar motor switch protein FliG [Solirhodobacter olei]
MKPVKDHRKLRGPEKAAVLFLCLGEERGAELMKRLDEFDIHEITRAISGLGTIPQPVIEGVINEFLETASHGGSVVGSMGMAEAMLMNFLPANRVSEIMDDIQGPLMGRNMWENFSKLDAQVIANAVKDEHDQTIAAILSKVRPEVSAKVLPLLGNERMMDVIERMIGIESVPRQVLQQIEETLQQEFMTASARSAGPDPTQRMADLFNKLDRTLFEEVSETLEARIPEAFGAIKQRMFIFDDLIKLDQQGLARVMRTAEGNTLPLALRGARKEVRDAFLGALPARSREMLLEEMSSMGPVRGRDVQAAQSALVDAALDLAAEEVIRLPIDDDDVIIE